MIKKLFYISLSLLTLPLIGLAQKDSINNAKRTSFKNQVDLDVYFLGVEGSYKKRIADKLFIGIGLGALMYKPAINSELKLKDGVTEFVRVRPFIDFILNTNFHFETGLAIAPFAYIEERNSYGSSVGLEAGIFLKIWKLEVGLRPSLTFYKKNTKKYFSSPKLTTSLLIIKIPLSRW